MGRTAPNRLRGGTPRRTPSRFGCSREGAILCRPSSPSACGGERVGTLSVLCQDEEARVLSQLKLIIRPMYSRAADPRRAHVGSLSDAALSSYHAGCAATAAAHRRPRLKPRKDRGGGVGHHWRAIDQMACSPSRHDGAVRRLDGGAPSPHEGRRISILAESRQRRHVAPHPRRTDGIAWAPGRCPARRGRLGPSEPRAPVRTKVEFFARRHLAKVEPWGGRRKTIVHQA